MILGSIWPRTKSGARIESPKVKAKRALETFRSVAGERKLTDEQNEELRCARTGEGIEATQGEGIECAPQ